MATYEKPQIFIRELGSRDNTGGDSRLSGGDIYFVPAGKSAVNGSILYQIEMLSHNGNSNRPIVYLHANEYRGGKELSTDGHTVEDTQDTRDSLRRIIGEKLEEIAEEVKESFTPEIRNNFQ